MKTIATLVAAAALLTGASVTAHAQGTAGSGAGASNNAQYCLDIRGAKTCTFQTLAACQQAAGASGKCAQNPNYSASKSDPMKSRAMEPKGSGSKTQ